MNKMNLKKIKNNLFYGTASALVVFSLGLVSAMAQQVFMANLSGAQEVPAVATAGRGVCKATLNAAQTQLTVNCRYSGLSSAANAAHIHGNGAVGTTAPVLFDFGAVSGTTGTITPAPINLSAQQVADLRANRMYVNIHTANNGSGEIRGQLHVANGVLDDYDGDGRTDPTVFRPSEGTWWSQQSLNGATKMQRWGLGTDITALNADFDGDGISDYAAIRVNQTNGQLTTYFLQSETSTMRVETFGNAAFGDQLGTGDFDGDGKFDIGVFRNGLWIYVESGTGATRYIQWGQPNDFPVQGDFDRDGKYDLAVARLAGGQYTIYILQTSNNQLSAVQFGQSGDTIINHSDYDGDGATDVTAVRSDAANRIFYTRRSSDGQVTATRWGLPTDAIRIGDFDGDGKSDYVVVRNQSNNFVWYVLQSSNNQLRPYYWGIAGDR